VVAFQRHVVTDQRRALQRLHLHELAAQAFDRGVELRDAVDVFDLAPSGW